MSVYEPLEDSFLLAEQVRKYAKGIVLDIGTGSGIQALEAAKKKSVKSVVAVDIDPEAIGYCRKFIKNKKIKFFLSDLFAVLRKQTYDTILFNPPYLPAERDIEELALIGGKKGYETIERFLNSANEHLNPDGKILLLFSSLTNKQKVEEIISNNLLEFRQVASTHFFFEAIYVYLLQKNALLKELEKKGVTSVKYLAKGKRGVVYTGVYKGKKIAIKVKRKESFAVGRMKNEAKFLKILNRYEIGPKFLFAGKNYVVYEFAEGDFIKDWLGKASKSAKKKVFADVFKQCFMLDQLGINKKEMHHPLKHIIIGKKATLIDFERAHYTKEVKNVTQFANFAAAVGLIERKKMIALTKNYTQNPSKRNFLRIVGAI